MKTLKAITLLFLGMLLSVQARSQKDTTREAVRTKAEWEEALTRAEEEEKLLFLDCVTEWCGWCKVMDRKTFTDERVRENLNESFIKLKIDMEYGFGKVLARKYKVQGYPTFLVFNEEGNMIHRSFGYRPPSSFLELLEKASDPKNWMEQDGVSSELRPGFPEFYKNAYEPSGSDKRSSPDPDTLQKFLEEQEDPFSEVSWAVMYRFPLPQSFKEFFFDEMERYEEHYGTQEVKKKVKEIFRRELRNAAEKEESDEEDLNRIMEKVDAHYEWDDREAFLEGLRSSWHRQRKEWEAYGRVVIKSLEEKELKGKGMMVNQHCWRIHEKVEDREILEQATELMNRAIEENEVSYAMADTYAHLLHKTDRIEEAERWAEKAIEIGNEEEKDTAATEKLLEKLSEKEK